MMNIIGQDDLLKHINTLIKNKNFPQSFIISGKKGSGKHLILNYISTSLGMSYIDSTSLISVDYIMEAVTSPIPKIHMFDVNALTTNKQNALLKFIEEPTRNVYIAILVEDVNDLITTIRNRCYLFTIKKYTRDVLSKFSNDSLILNYCSTPGEILSVKLDIITKYIGISNKLITVASKSSIANLMLLLNKLKEDDNIDVFMKVLISCSKNYCNTVPCKKSFDIYNEICSCYKSVLKCKNQNIDRIISKCFINLFLLTQ